MEAELHAQNFLGRLTEVDEKVEETLKSFEESIHLPAAFLIGLGLQLTHRFRNFQNES